MLTRESNITNIRLFSAAAIARLLNEAKESTTIKVPIYWVLLGVRFQGLATHSYSLYNLLRNISINKQMNPKQKEK